MIARCLAIACLLCLPGGAQTIGEAKAKEERAAMEKQLFPLLQEADELVLYSLYPVDKEFLEKEPDEDELGAAFGVGRVEGVVAPNEVDKKVAALARKAELFEGYPILGKEEIKDPTQRGKVLAAIRAAMETDQEDPGSEDCFEPRHGILVGKGGTSLRFTICFGCSDTCLNGAPESAQAGAKAFNHFKSDFAAFLNARFKAAGLVHPPYRDHPPKEGK